MGREKVQLISVSETADFPGPSFQMKEDGTLMETAGRIKKQSALFPLRFGRSRAAGMRADAD